MEENNEENNDEPRSVRFNILNGDGVPVLAHEDNNDDNWQDNDIFIDADDILYNESEEEEEDEEQPVVRSIALNRDFNNIVLEAVRHPMRVADGNISIRLFARGRPQTDEDDNNDDDESISDNAEKFDTDLPAEHSYLGSSMVRVSGVNYLEANKEYRLLIFMQHSMLFPGETLPMIIPDYMFDSSLLYDEGILFGVVFPNIWKTTRPNLYGVTCQIYEKGNDSSGNVILKSRIHQRFVITQDKNPNFLELLKPHERKIYANVRILPEIVLPDPLSAINLGSMNRFRNINSMSNTLKRMQAATTPWPQFVYKQYDTAPIIEQAKHYLSQYKIESMPTDMVLLSFWLAKNILLDIKERIKVFSTNSVNIRMKIIEMALDNKRYFCCRICKSKIAHGDSLFAMSKHGVQSNYCNPSGFIHETKTVYRVLENSVHPTGSPSTQFSWFPGYSWQIILCCTCDTHIGWKFASQKSNLIPKKFYGLSGSNILIDYVKKDNTSEGESTSTSNDIRNEAILLLR